MANSAPELLHSFGRVLVCSHVIRVQTLKFRIGKLEFQSSSRVIKPYPKANVLVCLEMIIDIHPMGDLLYTGKQLKGDS